MHTVFLENKAWDVPSLDELMAAVFLVRKWSNRDREIRTSRTLADREVPDKTYRFSAAASANHYLRSIGPLRCHVRRIVLLEDHRAVPGSLEHGQGFLPFIAENPQLRIERRIDLWRTIFTAHTLKPLPVPGHHKYDVPAWLESRGLTEPEPDVEFLPAMPRASPLVSELISWLHEAQVLPPNMTLVLDEDPAPGQCAEIFRSAMLRPAVIQAAMRESFQRDHLRMPGYWQWRAPDVCLEDTFQYHLGILTRVCRKWYATWHRIARMARRSGTSFAISTWGSRLKTSTMKWQ
jgi:hypothetical protein